MNIRHPCDMRISEFKFTIRSKRWYGTNIDSDHPNIVKIKDSWVYVVDNKVEEFYFVLDDAGKSLKELQQFKGEGEKLKQQNLNFYVWRKIAFDMILIVGYTWVDKKLQI